jgi:predicted negative regulator of RcsB-dependent stress response
LAHISRRELKKDSVRETFAHGADALLAHQQQTLYLIIAAIIVALAVFGWRTYSQRQTVKAFAGFDDAMTVFQAPVGAPPTAGVTTYSDQTKKFTEAESKFAAVASKYPRTRAGELARYYQALSLEKIGKDKDNDAKKSLQALADSRDRDVASLAQFELAAIDDRAGQGNDAAVLYQHLLANPTILVPKPVVMLALAEHYGAKNPSEAAKLYGQIKADYPDTPIAEQADEALALLPSKS